MAFRETPIPKAKHSGIGKLNDPAQRRVMRLKFRNEVHRNLLAELSRVSRDILPVIKMPDCPLVFFNSMFFLALFLRKRNIRKATI